MALVTMASTEEAIDALIVSFSKQFSQLIIIYVHFVKNFDDTLGGVVVKCIQFVICEESESLIPEASLEGH